jgi:hypothetical protein
MKPTSSRDINSYVAFGPVIISIFLASSIYGQKVEITSISSDNNQQSDHNSNMHVVAHHPKAGEAKKPPIHEANAVKENNTVTTTHHSALSTHKIFHHRTPATLSPEVLITGNTYNRYGEKSNPKGYGIQVMTFKKIKNLQKFLHTYHKKDMYIQVVKFDTDQDQMYRVILGAEENKNLVEQEISIFQKAGVSAVVRKHKTLLE